MKVNPLISKVKKRILIFLLGLFVLVFCTLTTVDHSPLKEQEYYKESKEILKQISLSSSDTSRVKAGWAKANITPDFSAVIVGFGKNGAFSGVMDSLYVRSIVFEQSNKKYLYLSYDLMIMHPYLVHKIEEKLKNEGLIFDGIYYTATHTHNGLGGYGDKPSGLIALGGIDDKVIDLILSKTVESVTESILNKSPVSYNYGVKNTKIIVKNRLDRDNGQVDDKMRVLQLKNEKGERLSLVTFAAHATCLPRTMDSLSADYPGELVRLLEKSKRVDFAVFSAGGVGSHAPTQGGLSGDDMRKYAERVSWRAFELIVNDEFEPLTNISFAKTEIPLRSPHLKVVKNIRLRPWLFEAVMGEGVGKLQFLKLDNVVFVGTPCDFSGELSLEIESEIKNKKLSPVVTSFNGEYIGYITPDKYYYWDTHEVRDVNWFGPYNGQYFKESILDVLNNIEK